MKMNHKVYKYTKLNETLNEFITSKFNQNSVHILHPPNVQFPTKPYMPCTCNRPLTIKYITTVVFCVSHLADEIFT